MESITDGVISPQIQMSDAQNQQEIEVATTVQTRTEVVDLVHEQGLETPSPSPTKVKKRKPSRPPSSAWRHFTKKKDFAFCNYCFTSYAANSSTHGTSNMLKHLKACLKNPYRKVSSSQKTLALGKGIDEDDPNSVSFKLVDFNQEKSRLALAKMIITDELPFKFVENEGFRKFIDEIQPRLKIPPRITIARDCIQVFNAEKELLKCVLSSNHQMVSLTTDTWTSIQNMNYMCVTGHYIDDGWALKRKILHFGLISDHKGESIGIALENCMKEWGIKKICCVTIDNASSNSVAISYLSRGVCVWNGKTLLKGEYMHLRCCAHILNLIVSEGLKYIDVSIAKIRAACKFVKSSPSRLEYVEAAYKISLESDFGSCPNQDYWNRARVFTKFLKVFYDATLSFSSSLHATANTFFKKLIGIQKSLNIWVNSDDETLKKMTTKMQEKFNKYWDSGEINFLLFVAIFLDPRYKYDYIEFCFKKMYGVDKCEEMMAKLYDLVKKLFEQYMVEYPVSIETCGSNMIPSNVATSEAHGGNFEEEDWENQFRFNMRIKLGEVQRNELERYVEDGIEENVADFDILKWWKGKANKYHALSRIARDVLAIPVSTVSSESAFSSGGRVLDAFRSSLNPSTVQALICSLNWIKSPKIIDFQAELDEEEKIELELSQLASDNDEATIHVDHNRNA